LNIPKAKHLWIHYDEKWFYGFVTQSDAKKCPELGLKKEVHAIYHPNHISKVMAEVFTGYTMDDHVEYGGRRIAARLLAHPISMCWSQAGTKKLAR
jgi:hypothetical protein